MDDQCQKFNICAALAILDELFQRVDNIIYIKSGITSNIWCTPADIPTREEFNTTFDSKQESVRNLPPK
eukprot:7168287-Ditylum_brightwellii.AAC.1